MTEPLKVGYIGTGWPGRVQTRVFSEEGLVPIAVCSRKPANARRLADTHAIPEVYADWRELIDSPNVDLVSITTPPRLHAEMATAALRAGRHVLCESPLMNVDEAEALAAVSGEAAGMALVDFELRFTPGVRVLLSLLREGALGRLLRLELAYRYDYGLDPAAPWSWEHDAVTGGGQLRMVAGHLVDLVLLLGGPATLESAHLSQAYDVRRTSEGKERAVTADDHAELVLQLKDGAVATVTASAMVRDHLGVWVSAHGTERSAILDPDHRLTLRSGTGDAMRVEEVDLGNTRLPSEERRHPFTLGTRFFARALSTGSGKVPADAAGFPELLEVQRILDSATERRTNEE